MRPSLVRYLDCRLNYLTPGVIVGVPAESRDKINAFASAIMNGKLTSTEIRVTANYLCLEGFKHVVVLCLSVYLCLLISKAFCVSSIVAITFLYFLVLCGGHWRSKDLILSGGMRADQDTRVLVPALLEKANKISRGKVLRSSTRNTAHICPAGIQDFSDIVSIA